MLALKSYRGLSQCLHKVPEQVHIYELPKGIRLSFYRQEKLSGSWLNMKQTLNVIALKGLFIFLLDLIRQPVIRLSHCGINCDI